MLLLSLRQLNVDQSICIGSVDGDIAMLVIKRGISQTIVRSDQDLSRETEDEDGAIGRRAEDV